jgi:hypothetical protein
MSVVVIDDEVLQFQTGSHDKIIASEKACCNSKHMDIIYFYATLMKDYNFLFLFYILAERIKGTYEKPRYDGWYNNLAHPEWGSVGKLTFFFSWLV